MLSDVQLLGITYSEFDNKVGPQLKYSYPVDVLSKEAFEAYSDYVIVSKQLCEKIIVVAFDDIQFLNYSVAIDNVKYHRNALLFAFGFVLLKGVNVEPYCAVLEKISSTFVNLEIESEYLFQQENRYRIQEFLRTLFFQLNEKNEAFIDLGLNNSYLAVKLYKNPVKPPEIKDYEVPIFRRDRIDLSNLPWDISFQHLIPHIDGISHVKKIVYEVGMDIDSVKRSLKLLEFHGAILLTDVFKFTNVYKLNTDVAMPQLSNPAVLQEMRTFAAIQGRTAADIPTAQQVIAFLLQLQANRSIQQILLDSLPVDRDPNQSPRSPRGDVGASLECKSEDCVDTPSPYIRAAVRPLDLQHMDIARLLAFSNALGITRRVYEYPLYVASDTPSSPRYKPSASTDAFGVFSGRRNPSANSLESQQGGSSRRGSSTAQQPQLATLFEQQQQQGSSENKHPEGILRRSGNLPMPNTTARWPTTTHSEEDTASGNSVGLSGVLSAGTSFNFNPGATYIKEIGLRRSSFDPEHRDWGREQDRRDSAGNGATGPVGSRHGQSLSENPHNSERSLAEQSHHSMSTLSVTTPTAGGVQSNAMHMGARTLHRMASRSRMTATGLPTGSHSSSAASSGNTASASTPGGGVNATATMSTGRYPEVKDILHRLNGKEHADAICCRYDLSFQDLASFPGVQLIYK